jgi:hypothetical protein
MTKAQITELARKAGFEISEITGSIRTKSPVCRNELERFAALVAAAEREACANVCDQKVDAEYATGKVDHNEIGWTQSCAIAIRARCEQVT